MKKNQITILGSGTCQIQTHRMASSILIELEDLNFVYDFGRGVSQRLFELGLRQDEIQHIIFSHFHPDHFSDIIPYLQAGSYSRIDKRSGNIHLYGPRGIRKLISGLYEILGEDTLNKGDFEVIVHENQNDFFDIEGHRFYFEFLTHYKKGINYGLKFVTNEKTIAFTSDSGYHHQEINFLKDVDLAIVDGGHLSEEEIIELAIKSKVKKIVCTHLYKELEEKTLQNQATNKGFNGVILVAEDLMKIEI